MAIDLRARIAAAKAAKEAAANASPSPAPVEPIQEAIAEKAVIVETVVEAPVVDAPEESKSIHPRILELESILLRDGKLGLKDKIELIKLKKEFPSDATSNQKEESHEAAEETEVTKPAVREEANQSQIQDAPKDADTVEDQDIRAEVAAVSGLVPTELPVAGQALPNVEAQPDRQPMTADAMEKRQHAELLAKEKIGVLTLKERLTLNKYNVKYAPLPTELPDATLEIVESDPIAVATHALQEEGKKMSFAERLAMKRAAQEADALAMSEEPTEALTSSLNNLDPRSIVMSFEPTVQEEKIIGESNIKLETFSVNITLNAEQLMAKELAAAGKSFCLIGAAGTGKTSTQRDVAKSLWQSGQLRMTDFKIAGGGGQRANAPSIAFCAYTRRASANLARAIHKDPELCEVFSNNIMTVHHLLEYEPVYFYDNEKEKESMRFEPQRHAGNPLEITHLVVEEASMLGLDLWEKLYDALPSGVQIIFIGDINQLPPVFGSSILNYALVQLPVVELKKVYRQQGDSLVLANAHHILKGENLEEGNGFTIVRGKSPVQVGQGKMAQTLASMFKQLYASGDYNPDDCIILSPFNKADLGTDNMNKHIAQFLGTDRGAIVHEVLAGMNKVYIAVGDKVMFNKQDGVITKISHNGLYHGKNPQLPGADLTRFGVRILGMDSNHDVDLDAEDTLGYETFSLEQLQEEQAERKQQASHIVDIELETGITVTLDSAGDFGSQIFTLGYVLTVHKAQGCEWRKVFGILHKDHAVLLNRELFYTMVTRAREEVVLIAKDTVLEKAIRSQKIKGDSLSEKIEYFNSGAVDQSAVACTK